MPLQEEFEFHGSFLFRYRGVLPIAILVLAILAFIPTAMAEPKQIKLTNEVYSYCCLFITLIGLAIRIFTVGYSAQNTSGRNTKSQIADDINTTGIYSIVRHPLYLGNFFMWLGIALLTESPWFVLAFIFIYWVYYERIMFAEEQFLRKKFDLSYIVWATYTPAFIPNFRLYKPPVRKFSFKKVIRQEKTGLLLTFLIFFLFDAIKSVVSNKKLFIKLDFWFYAFIVALAAYVIIKLLQKKTKLMN
jgi:protein-S-isoprenylcysteine O-methyltransferase Ste14